MVIKLITINENGEIEDFKSILPKFKFEDVAKYILAKELGESKMAKKSNEIKNKNNKK